MSGRDGKFFKMSKQGKNLVGIEKKHQGVFGILRIGEGQVKTLRGQSGELLEKVTRAGIRR